MIERVNVALLTELLVGRSVDRSCARSGSSGWAERRRRAPLDADRHPTPSAVGRRTDRWRHGRLTEGEWTLSWPSHTGVWCHVMSLDDRPS